MVFAVKYRQNFIQNSWKDPLYKYITQVIQNDDHKMLAINGMPDHIHIFLGLNPAIAISEVVKDVKRASNNWVNNTDLCSGKFAWQSGYGAFSYSRSHISKVCNYIKMQELHHTKKSFQQEYREMLEKFQIEFKDEYLFEFYE